MTKKFMFRKRFRLADILEAQKQPTIQEKEVSGRQVIDVTLTDTMQKYAASIGVRIREKAEEERAKGTGPRERLGIFGDVEKEAIGILGALAAAAYLVKNWRAALDFTVIGKADEGDLVITIKEESLKVPIDVKTRASPLNTYFMLPLYQFDEKAYDFYVSCQKIDDNTFRIQGYATRQILQELVSQFKELNMPIERIGGSDVEDSGVYDFGYGATITIPFNKLPPIRDFKARLIL